MPTLRKKQLIQTLSVRKSGWMRILVLLLNPVFTLILCQLVTIQSVPKTAVWLWEHLGAATGTCGLLLVAGFFFYALTGKLFWSTSLVLVPSMVLSFVSYYETLVNGVPLRISDFAMVGAAGSLMGFLGCLRPTAMGVCAVILALSGLALLHFFDRGMARPVGRFRLVAGVASFAILLIFAIPKPQYVSLQNEVETQAERNDRLGLLLGLLTGGSPVVVKAPAGYGQGRMDAILSQMEENTVQTVPAVEPTVIFFMSESFFDVTRLPNVTYSRDPVPNFHALSETCTSGAFLSNTYGGGTGNVEMEVFTGMSSDLLGENVTPTTLKEEESYEIVPSLIKLFSDMGYDTAAVHSYTNELYNRGITFPKIGFQHLYFEDSFAANAAQKGGYISDDALVNKMISVYQNRDASAPLFLYGLSMENHQPYPADKFEVNSNIAVTADGLSESERGILNTIVTGISDADASLGKLVRYFETVDEPVMIVFWGDHLPSLYTDEESTVYTSLGYSTGGTIADWSADKLKQMISTNYLIWTNYEEESEADRDTSAMLLGVDVLDRLGFPKTPYFNYIDKLGEDMLLYREQLFVAADGTAYSKIPVDMGEKIDNYCAILYDALYGKGYITEAMNTLP